jgi:hypothetical protein
MTMLNQDHAEKINVRIDPRMNNFVVQSYTRDMIEHERHTLTGIGETLLL